MPHLALLRLQILPRNLRNPRLARHPLHHRTPADSNCFTLSGLFESKRISSLPISSEFSQETRTPARPPRIPKRHSPLPCPSRHPAVRKPATCSSTRCPGPLAANTAGSPLATSRSSSKTVPAAPGNRTATSAAHRPSNIANAPVPAVPAPFKFPANQRHRFFLRPIAPESINPEAPIIRRQFRLCNQLRLASLSPTLP